MELTGKVAFITGGADGIGKEFVRALLERGAKVSFGDVNQKSGEATLKEFQEQFGKDTVRFYAFDVTNMDAFEKAFNEAVSIFGAMDIFINNAGIMNEAAWYKMIDINVTGVVKGVKLAEKIMRKDFGGKGGRIINIASCAALWSTCYVPVYSATKHAVRALTSGLAMQFDIEAQGIQYGQLCPDTVDTQLARSIDADKVNYYEEVKDSFADTIPPSRVVEGLLKLLSLEQMNGAVLHVRKDALMYMKVEKQELGIEWKQIN